MRFKQVIVNTQVITRRKHASENSKKLSLKMSCYKKKLFGKCIGFDDTEHLRKGDEAEINKKSCESYNHRKIF